MPRARHAGRPGRTKAADCRCRSRWAAETRSAPPGRGQCPGTRDSRLRSFGVERREELHAAPPSLRCCSIDAHAVPQSTPWPALRPAGNRSRRPPVRHTRCAQSCPVSWASPALRGSSGATSARYSRGVRARSAGHSGVIPAAKSTPNRQSESLRATCPRPRHGAHRQATTASRAPTRLRRPAAMLPAQGGRATCAPVAATPRPAPRRQPE